MKLSTQCFLNLAVDVDPYLEHVNHEDGGIFAVSGRCPIPPIEIGGMGHLKNNPDRAYELEKFFSCEFIVSCFLKLTL